MRIVSAELVGSTWIVTCKMKRWWWPFSEVTCVFVSIVTESPFSGPRWWHEDGTPVSVETKEHLNVLLHVYRDLEKRDKELLEERRVSSKKIRVLMERR